MPRGRKRTQEPCGEGKRRRGRRLLLRPSILVMLLEEPAHGYQLADMLTERGIVPEHLDSSAIYRDLREMEEHGWIESHWDEDSKGPRRRVYKVTERGLNCLEAWMENLGAVGERIGDLIARFQVLRQGGHDEH